jgi:hypothetical protein
MAATPSLIPIVKVGITSEAYFTLSFCFCQYYFRNIGKTASN